MVSGKGLFSVKASDLALVGAAILNLYTSSLIFIVFIDSGSSSTGSK